MNQELDTRSSGGNVSKTRKQPPSKRQQGNKKKKHKNELKKRLIILAVAEVFVLALIFGYAFVARKMSLTQRPDIKSEELVNQELTNEKKEHMQGYWTIAVFGVDSRNGNVLKGTNADVVMICNINMDTGEVKLASVYRDTYLNTDEKGTYNKINAAYALGGPEQAIKALNRNLDLNITDFVTFNWKAVADGINILGGVDIEITKPEFAYINGFITETVEKTGVGSHHLKKPGLQTLDGIQAVAYGRLRLMDTDFARTQRQRLVIEKAFEKAKKADFSVLNNILVTVSPQVAHTFNLADVTDLVKTISKFHIGETTGFPMELTTQIMGKKGDCVIPKTLEENVSQLHGFLYDKQDYEPTASVKKISNKILEDASTYRNVKPSTQARTEEETKESYLEKSTGIEDTDESGNVTSSKVESSSSVNSGSTSGGSTGTTLESSSSSVTKPSTTLPGESSSSGSASGPGVTTEAPKESILESSKPITPTLAPETTTSSGPGSQVQPSPTVVPIPLPTQGNVSPGPGGP